MSNYEYYVVVYLRPPAILPRVFGPFLGQQTAESQRRALIDREGLDEDLLVVVKMEPR